jgi:Tol biopolymer transport system component
LPAAHSSEQASAAELSSDRLVIKNAALRDDKSDVRRVQQAAIWIGHVPVLALTTLAPLAVTLSRPSVEPGLLVSVSWNMYARRPPKHAPDLVVIRATGERVRLLTRTVERESDPAWSPDGARIAFVLSPACEDRGCEAPVKSGIWVVPSDGGTALRLTRGPRARSDGSPAWSPDGRRLVFRRRGGIYIIGADGRGLRRLVAGNALGVDWSPDGNRIVYVGLVRPSNEISTPRLRVVDLRTGHGETLAVRGLGGDARDAAWSPDGRRLAVSTTAGIYVLAGGGGKARRLTAGASYSAPSWAPDGLQLAFTGPSRGLTKIYRVRSDGKALRLMTKGPRSYSWPDWRPRT